MEATYCLCPNGPNIGDPTLICPSLGALVLNHSNKSVSFCFIDEPGRPRWCRSHYSYGPNGPSIIQEKLVSFPVWGNNFSFVQYHIPCFIHALYGLYAHTKPWNYVKMGVATNVFAIHCWSTEHGARCTVPGCNKREHRSATASIGRLFERPKNSCVNPFSTSGRSH